MDFGAITPFVIVMWGLGQSPVRCHYYVFELFVTDIIIVQLGCAMDS
jgi:hypothetical protein